MNNYDDIIDKEYPFLLKHPRMSMLARASQFAPFAALTGYDEAIKEEGRGTLNKMILDDDIMNNIDWKLRIIKDKIKEKPTIIFRYFVKDATKSGGRYVTTKGIVKKIDDFKGIIILTNNDYIVINDIVDIISEENLFEE